MTRLSAALAHLESAQRQTDPRVAAVDVSLAIRACLDVLVGFSSGQHRCGDGGSICSPSENAAEARRVIEQLRGGT